MMTQSKKKSGSISNNATASRKRMGPNYLCVVMYLTMSDLRQNFSLNPAAVIQRSGLMISAS